MPTFSVKSARAFYKNGEYAAAMLNYMSILKHHPNKAALLEAEFLDCFNSFCQARADTQAESQHEDSDRNEKLPIDEISDHFLFLSDIFSNSAQFFGQWGDFLLKNGLHEEAALCFMKSLTFAERDEATTSSPAASRKILGKKPSVIARHACRALSELRDQLVDQWHFRMLNDRARNEAYEVAIKLAIEKLKNSKENVRVLDLGCGTGILSMAAVRHGAHRVYAVDHSQIMCHVTEKILASNGMQEKIKLIGKNSFDLTPEDLDNEKVDLIVTELMDAGFFGENIVGYLLDAKNRFLNHDGRIIPSIVDIRCALVESEFIKLEHTTPSNVKLAGHVILSTPIFSAASVQNSTDPVDCIEPYDCKKLAKIRKNSFRLLSEPESAFKFDLNDSKTLDNLKFGVKSHFKLRAISAGSLNAVASWFTLRLSDDVTLNSGPTIESCWEQAIFPMHLVRGVNSQDALLFEAGVKENWFKLKLSDRLCCIEPERLIIDVDPLLCINDTVTLNTFRLFFESYANTVKSSNGHTVGISVLDFTMDPVLPILLCKLLPNCSVRSISGDCTAYCSQMLLDDNPDVRQNVQLYTGKSFDASDFDQKIDLLLINPLDTKNGLLKCKALEDVAYYRLKFGPDVILPNRLDLWGQLVSSDELLNYARVGTDQSTLGFKISEAVNVFDIEILRDLELTTLHHSNVTSKCKLLSIDFQAPIPTVDTSARAKHSSDHNLPSILYQRSLVELKCGKECKVDALIFWFELSCTFCAGVSLDTSDPENRFCQASYILRQPLNVCKNDTVIIESILSKSCLKFTASVKSTKNVSMDTTASNFTMNSLYANSTDFPTTKQNLNLDDKINKSSNFGVTASEATENMLLSGVYRKLDFGYSIPEKGQQSSIPLKSCSADTFSTLCSASCPVTPMKRMQICARKLTPSPLKKVSDFKASSDFKTSSDFKNSSIHEKLTNLSKNREHFFENQVEFTNTSLTLHSFVQQQEKLDSFCRENRTKICEILHEKRQELEKLLKVGNFASNLSNSSLNNFSSIAGHANFSLNPTISQEEISFLKNLNAADLRDAFESECYKKKYAEAKVFLLQKLNFDFEQKLAVANDLNQRKCVIFDKIDHLLDQFMQGVLSKDSQRDEKCAELIEENVKLLEILQDQMADVNTLTKNVEELSVNLMETRNKFDKSEEKNEKLKNDRNCDKMHLEECQEMSRYLAEEKFKLEEDLKKCKQSETDLKARLLVCEKLNSELTTESKKLKNELATLNSAHSSRLDEIDQSNKSVNLEIMHDYEKRLQKQREDFDCKKSSEIRRLKIEFEASLSLYDEKFREILQDRDQTMHKLKEYEISFEENLRIMYYTVQQKLASKYYELVSEFASPSGIVSRQLPTNQNRPSSSQSSNQNNDTSATLTGDALQKQQRNNHEISADEFLAKLQNVDPLPSFRNLFTLPGPAGTCQRASAGQDKNSTSSGLKHVQTTTCANFPTDPQNKY